MHVLMRIGKAAYEVNRAYCEGLSSHSLFSWEDMPAELHDSVSKAVFFHTQHPNATVSESHAAWCSHKKAEGWTWGPGMNFDKKEHPSLVEFERLPAEQQAQFRIFQAVIRQCLDNLLAR